MYSGLIQTFDFGIGGLHTDDPNTQIPVTNLIRATNISYEGQKIQKAAGSSRLNQQAFSAGVVGAFDWWPSDIEQRLIVVLRNGQVWRSPDNGYSQAQILNALDPNQNTLQVNNQVTLVAGGAEAASNPRKLFVISGSNPIQVIAGDGQAMTSISKPSLDWPNQISNSKTENGLTTNTIQPASGIIHQGRLWVWGNLNNPHFLYASNPDDHEDFQTQEGASLNFSVYPGEFQKILTCCVFKGRMWIFKYPFGVYYLDDSDPSYLNWVIRKYSDKFGAASAHSSVEVLNDLLIANCYGSVTSYNAVQYYGGFDMADVLKNYRNFRYVRENISPNGALDRHCIYYEYKKQAFIAYRSSAGIKNDRLLMIDYDVPASANPKCAWWDKDQANCLFLRKDVNLVPRPAYGSDDGFVYLMDQVDRDNAGAGYQSDFMTPHFDFTPDQVNVMTLPRQLAEVNKLFDFLELTFENAGKWNLNVDVFIDGQFSETLAFQMSKFRGTNEAILNEDRTYDGAPLQQRLELHGSGKRIALRFYNANAGENFKLLRAQIYYRPGSQGEKDDS